MEQMIQKWPLHEEEVKNYYSNPVNDWNSNMNYFEIFYKIKELVRKKTYKCPEIIE